MKNAWGYDLPSITDVLSRENLENDLTEIVSGILDSIGKSSSETSETIKILFDSTLRNDILKLEKTVHNSLACNKSSENKLDTGMHDRSRTIFTEIEQHLTGDSLADVGCGHGLVSWMAHQKFKEVMLFDVVDYRYPEVNLPIQVYEENQDASFDKKYDCTLLITVLHHSQDPLRLLKHVWKHTNKRLIIIESVFGVDPSSGGKESPLYKLNETDQQYYAVFCDWFYNRVLNQDVPVPYNFNTPQKWKTLFQEELSAIVSYEEDLAIDIPIVPEHHFLFVLDKK